MKRFFKNLFFLPLSFIIFSCTQTSSFQLLKPELNQENQKFQKVSVTFDVKSEEENSMRKTILPTAIDVSNFTCYEISGDIDVEPNNEYDIISEEEKHYYKRFYSYNDLVSTEIKLIACRWKFTLKAYMDIEGTETLVSQYTSYCWLGYDQKNTINLFINFNSVNNAKLDITVNIPYHAADSVTVSLNYFNGADLQESVNISPITIFDDGTEKSYFYIKKDDLNVSDYYLKMQFYKNDSSGVRQLICTKLQYVVLKSYHTTKAELTYTELNTPYMITYICADDHLSQLDWTLSGGSPSPDSYNTSQDIVLQPINNTTVSRTGHTLQEETWYEDYECTKPITGWAAGEKTGDIIVYSKWEKLPGVPLYVYDSGNNSNDGLTMETALKTFDAAWNKAAANPDYNAIYMVDNTNYSITTNVNWDGAIAGARENLLIKRVCSEAYDAKTVGRPLFYLSSGCTTAVFSNLILDGGADWGPTGAVGWGLGLPGAEEGKIQSSMPLISGTANSCTLTLKSGCEIRNNHCSATSNPGGIILNGPSLVVDGAKIYNNYGGNGGGIKLTQYSSVTLKSGTIGGTKIFAGENKNECDGNFSTSGGGVYGGCGIPAGSTGQICYNVSSDGAGIYMLNTDIINIQGGKIHNNYAMQNESGSYTAKPGAAISYSLSGSDPGDAWINNCEIYENYGESIIYCSYNPSGYSASGVVFNNTSIKNNYISMTSEKGAIYQYNTGKIKIYDGTIVDNNYLTSDPVNLVNEGDARAYNSDNANNHSLYFYGNGYLGNYILKNKNTFYVSKNILNTPLPAGITHLAVIEETSSYKYNVGAQVLEAEDSAATAAMSEISKRFALKDTDYKIDSEGKKAYSTSVSGGIKCTVGFDKELTFSVASGSSTISRATGGDLTIEASVKVGANSSTVSNFATEFDSIKIEIKNYDISTGLSSTGSNKVSMPASTISVWPTGNYEAYVTGKYAGYEFSATLHFTIDD